MIASDSGRARFWGLGSSMVRGGDASAISIFPGRGEVKSNFGGERADRKESAMGAGWLITMRQAKILVREGVWFIA